MFDIPLSEPCIAGNEDRYVLDALARNELAVGSYIGRFETMVAEYVGVRHAVAVSSGTAALHLALLVAGVGPGDEVIVPTLTFAATAFAVSYCGAHPVFIDVEPEYWTMDPWDMATHLPVCAWGGHRRLKAVLPVHLLGHPADMYKIAYGCSYFGLPVIEDVAEALGATANGRMVGSLGTLACLSFNATKTITAAGGGMVLTDDPDLAARVRHLANQAKVPGVEMEHDAVGFNYRMSNLGAAIGCAQMERLPEFLARKRAIAERYQRELADVPGISVMGEAPWARSSYWLSTIRVDAERYGIDSRALIARLADAGIQSRPLFKPLHLQEAYAGREHMPCPVADRAWREGVSLPSSVGLSEADQKVVVRAIKEWYNPNC